jgi:uncharacterized protein YjgD (DUF1641 family)
MAQPIPLELPPRDPRKELIARLEAAPADHAEALLDAFELLQELHDRHVFEVLRGALSAGDTIIEKTAKASDSPEAIHALRNLIILGKTLGSINPDVMESIAVAATTTLGSERNPVVEPPSLFSLLSQFRHKELRRSIALINRFLEALGNQLKLRSSTNQQN